MGDEEKPKLGWGGPRPGSGRPRGRIDPRPKEIREMLLQACALSDYGRDPAYPDEPGSALQSFVTLANNNLDIFAQLLLKTIPRQVNQQVESTIGLEVTLNTMQDVTREMERQGFSHREISAIKASLPMPIIEENGKPLDEEVHDDDILFDRNRDHD
jgi:hypothetical protein